MLGIFPKPPCSRVKPLNSSHSKHFSLLQDPKRQRNTLEPYVSEGQTKKNIEPYLIEFARAHSCFTRSFILNSIRSLWAELIFRWWKVIFRRKLVDRHFMETGWECSENFEETGNQIHLQNLLLEVLLMNEWMACS